MRTTHHRTNRSDEISDLVTGFNSMLAEIEQRDRQLLMQQTILEETVALRTEELRAAKDRRRASRRGQRAAGPGECADPEQRHGRDHGCGSRQPAHVPQSGRSPHDRNDAGRARRTNRSTMPSIIRTPTARLAGGGLPEHARPCARSIDREPRTTSCGDRMVPAFRSSTLRLRCSTRTEISSERW